ncbi:excinuclease ABC subunit B [Jannaschia marina]|uniref:excinuclease ABC subunit B n=1 Tax=Jannaschia marina TaxID=2741674 RepID=UPI0015C77E7D|nr:excinuclease ABC subunit B [Jannaschia marina]
MRTLVLFLLCLPQAVAAWTFAPEPICTVADTQDAVTIEVTFDPATALYAIAFTRAAGWPDTTTLALHFDRGMGDLTITTDRHVVEGPRLSVTDRGFGNVLRGLEFFGRATLLMDGLTLGFDTTQAGEPVRAFRDCPATPTA